MTDGAPADDRDGTEFTHDEGPDSGTDAGTETDREASDRTDPLADLAASVEGAADDRSRSSEPDFDDLFDRRDTAEIDGERLWAQLEGDDHAEMPVPVDREIREVEKRAYCQRCDYFTAPPEVACTHEDAEILTVPTTETFRVADCPFVLEDEALENGD
ncbi:hypothetical protein [Natrinema salaciae]|uniref:DUF8135 domain-containing protein n=1 Tax=Natrinema salaciae TaxID=1186196 RepID=A0A1H9BK05_9EURY|nr:hypothetical protein [Natrinema salaciae]SEP89322.1 hypothetical protein SAMN04489841_0775 [Natrinema salaciae]